MLNGLIALGIGFIAGLMLAEKVKALFTRIKGKFDKKPDDSEDWDQK